MNWIPKRNMTITNGNSSDTKTHILFTMTNVLAVTQYPPHSLQASFSSKNGPNPWITGWFPKRTMGEENGESNLRNVNWMSVGIGWNAKKKHDYNQWEFITRVSVHFGKIDGFPWSMKSNQPKPVEPIYFWPNSPKKGRLCKDALP